MVPLYINDVPINCINKAAVEYRVPASHIIAVLKTENGRVGMANKNRNGTYDLGPMQINTVWINKISKYGYTENDLKYDPCKNVEVGTWILSIGLAEGDNVKKGMGNYHSHTAKFNEAYSSKVVEKLNKIESIINT